MPLLTPSSARMRRIALWIAAAGFAAAGLNHFRDEPFYVRIVPPALPWKTAIVRISGVAEIVGGLGLLLRPLRRAAGWGLIALLAAVFPANLFMAVSPAAAGAIAFPRWALWARLPLQAVFVAWIVWVTGIDAGLLRWRNGKGSS